MSGERLLSSLDLPTFKRVDCNLTQCPQKLNNLTRTGYTELIYLRKYLLMSSLQGKATGILVKTFC